MNKLWIVKDPTLSGATLSLLDFMFSTTPADHARYVVGTGLAEYERQNHTLHFTEESAKLEVERRVEKLLRGIKAVRREIPSSDPDRDTVAAWAELRGRVSLSEVVDMVRQDFEAETVNTDEAQALARKLMVAVDQALGV